MYSSVRIVPGTSESLLKRLQSIQHPAARFLRGDSRRDDISPVLRGIVFGRRNGSTRSCEVIELHRTWSTTASCSRTLDALVSLRSRQRPHCSQNEHSIWRQEVLGCGTENLEESIPAALRQPYIEFRYFKRLLKAFLFCETAAH